MVAYMWGAVTECAVVGGEHRKIGKYFRGIPVFHKAVESYVIITLMPQ